MLKMEPPRRADLDDFLDSCRPRERCGQEPTWSLGDEGSSWRAFECEEVAKRHKPNLDLLSLKGSGLDDGENLLGSEVLAAEVVEDPTDHVASVSGDCRGVRVAGGNAR